VSGVPPPEIAVPPPKVVLHQLAMPFGQLILRKIVKIVPIRGHILRLKCTKFYFGIPQTPLRKLTALPQTS